MRRTSARVAGTIERSYTPPILARPVSVVAMADQNDFNQRIIDEFRANDGKVGPPFEGAPMLLLRTVGAKSGASRTTPLVYRPHGEAYAVFASYAGAPKHPAWFRNLVAQPDVTIEVGSEEVPVHARVTEGDEREQIWSAQKRDVPTFAEYEAKTGGREIPVVVLEQR